MIIGQNISAINTSINHWAKIKRNFQIVKEHENISFIYFFNGLFFQFMKNSVCPLSLKILYGPFLLYISLSVFSSWKFQMHYKLSR